MASPDGVEVHGPAREKYRDVLSDEALGLVAELQRELGPTREDAAGQAGRAPGGVRRRGAARLPRRDGVGAGGGLAGRAGGGAGRPAGRDHRADRPQDADQRPQLRGQGVHGRLRGRQRPDLGEHVRRPAEPGRRHRGHDQLREPRRPPLPPERRGGHPDAAAPGLAPAREARPGRRAGRPRAAWSTSGCSWPTGPGGCWNGARASTCTSPSWRATWRRGSGTTPSSSPPTGSASPGARSRRRC